MECVSNRFLKLNFLASTFQGGIDSLVDNLINVFSLMAQFSSLISFFFPFISFCILLHFWKHFADIADINWELGA